MAEINAFEIALSLHSARESGLPIEQMSQKFGTWPRHLAYLAQEIQMLLRLSKNPRENLVGWKMGLTSQAKRQQMNLDSPLYGYLTDQMEIPSGGSLNLGGLVHPKVEPEVAFLIKKDVHSLSSREEIEESIEAVCGALEILDSRYTEFKYFSMEDVIADNSSSCRFVLGPWIRNFDLKKKILSQELKMTVTRSDASLEPLVGSSVDISGDPLVSVMQLCELLATQGRYLRAGQIVLAGSATAAIALRPGDQVTLETSDLSSLQFFVRRENSPGGFQ